MLTEPCCLPGGGPHEGGKISTCVVCSGGEWSGEVWVSLAGRSYGGGGSLLRKAYHGAGNEVRGLG